LEFGSDLDLELKLEAIYQTKTPDLHPGFMLSPARRASIFRKFGGFRLDRNTG